VSSQPILPSLQLVAHATAPAQAKDLLAQARKQLGRVPDMYRGMTPGRRYDVPRYVVLVFRRRGG